MNAMAWIANELGRHPLRTLQASERVLNNKGKDEKSQKIKSEILAFIAEKGRCDVHKAAKQIDLTASSTRDYLMWMFRDGLLTRFRRGNGFIYDIPKQRADSDE